MGRHPTHHTESEMDSPIHEDHGVKHSVLVHVDKNHHTWTALPEVRREGCYRVFDDHSHYSPPAPMPSLTGVRKPSSIIGPHQIQMLALSSNLPNLPAVKAGLDPPRKGSSTRRASFSTDIMVSSPISGSAHISPAKHVHIDLNEDGKEEKKGKEKKGEEDAVGEETKSKRVDPHYLSPVENRRGSFTTIPDDSLFASMGGFSPRRESGIVQSADEASDTVPDSSSAIPPPPLNKQGSSTRPRTNSAMDQAISSMPKMYGSYAHDASLTVDPNSTASPNPSRTHRKKWKKIGRTVLQTSSGRLLEIKGTGATKRNSKIRKGFQQQCMNAVLAVKMFETDRVKVDISKYAVFLPHIISRDIACGGNRFTSRALSKRSSHSHFQAAVLFVDISGFTSLTEKLNQLGTHGAEQLCTHINAIYTKMMTEFKKWGGDVVKFSGDALLVMFEVYEEERLREMGERRQMGGIEPEEDLRYLNFTGLSLSLAEACQRAVSCGVILHDVIHTYPAVDGIKLKLHVGVGCGRCTGHVIGGVLGRWEFILTGEGVEQISEAEPAAGPLETVVSPDVWDFVKEDFDGEVLSYPYAGFVKVEKRVSCEKFLPKEENKILLIPKHISYMPSYLPNAVIMNLRAGVCDSTSQAEMRDLTIMFVSLPNLNLKDNIEIQSAVVAIQEATYQMEGSVNKVVVDDKGALILIAFGLPPVVHSDDPKRALASAFLMRHHLHDLGLKCQVGVASGRVFCGIVGAESRKEYTVMGDSVNLAARLMATSKPYEVLCDQSTYEQSLDSIKFKIKEPVKLKGKADLYNVYRPCSFLPPKTEISPAIGRQADIIELEAMVEIVAHDMSNIIIITGKPGMGKHTIAQHLEHICENNQLVVLRSGIGENIYLEGEVQAKTLFTAWRRVLIQALDILWSERTKQEKIAVRAEASANLIANLPFDIAEEIRHFMEEDELKNVHLLAMMFPEIANLGKQGEKKWFHDLSENDSEIGPDEGNSASPGSPTSRRRTMSDGQETENMYILDPKAHVNIHNDEKRLKKLLQDFFLKFCKRHPCLLTFENTYGMSSSGLAASSWALFHELIKPFHAVREKIAEEITKSEDILESNFDPHDHDLCPKFCFITNAIPRPGVEYIEAHANAEAFDTLLELGPMLDTDIDTLMREKLSDHNDIEKGILSWVSDMSEGNPSIIIELCHSIIESKICEVVDDHFQLKKGRTLHEVKLNSRLRHMVLQEFSALPLHDQLIAKMASVYTKEFSEEMLTGHVAQHQKDHSDTPIHLKKCIGNLIKTDIFSVVPQPAWMVNMSTTDASNQTQALEYRSKLMQKAVSELLLESHVTSVARSVNSIGHARRISAFWLQRAVDHEKDSGKQNALVADFLTSVPKYRRESMDADDLESASFLGTSGNSMKRMNSDLANLLEDAAEEDENEAEEKNSGRDSGSRATLFTERLLFDTVDLDNERIADEKLKKEKEEEKKEKEAKAKESGVVIETEEGKEGSFYEDGVDRRGITRNVNGFEEPHSLEGAELWNIDGCEVDLSAKYKLGGQMWYLQSRAVEHSNKGEPIPGIPMNDKAKDSGRLFGDSG